MFVLLVHDPQNGANGPAQDTEVLQGPLGPIHLLPEFLSHDVFSTSDVQMRQEHESLSHLDVHVD